MLAMWSSTALVLALVTASQAQGTDRPIIAIIGHPSDSSNGDCGGDCELIEASYVKWIESAGMMTLSTTRPPHYPSYMHARTPHSPLFTRQPSAPPLAPALVPGARAVPLGYSWSDDQVDELLDQVNGVLFPGGGSSVPPSAYRAVNRSLELADAGETLPVWGTCLGFEWVSQIVGGIHLTGGFDAENFSIPLILDEDLAADSRMLGSVDEMRGWLSTESITMNNHGYGVSIESFNESRAWGHRRPQHYPTPSPTATPLSCPFFLLLNHQPPPPIHLQRWPISSIFFRRTMTAPGRISCRRSKQKMTNTPSLVRSGTLRSASSSGA